MKFTEKRPCVCGGSFEFETCGDERWASTVCPKCGSAAGLLNHLSVSVVADRLLNRSKTELENGDYSLSIILGTIAVETFLIALFLKIMRMDARVYNAATAAQEEEWESEYPRSGGFGAHADVVSRKATGTPFDDFVSQNKTAIKIMTTLPDVTTSAKTYFQDALFRPRNRIVHWGNVNYKQHEAHRCHQLAVALVNILREMDKVKYGHL